MSTRLLPLTLTALLLLAACGQKEPAAAAPAAAAVAAAPAVPAGPTAAEADAFIAKYNDDFRAIYPDVAAAQWLQANFITDDSQLLASRANERMLSFNGEISQKAKPFYGLKDR